MDNAPNSPRGSLVTLRIIWAALLLGQLTFLGIVVWLIRQPGARAPVSPDLRRTLFILCAAWLVMAVPVGYFIRLKMFEKDRRPDGSVAPASYASGNIIFWALCEGVSLFAIVGILLAREMAPFIYITLIAVAVQAINFPTGAPLGER
jgi:hypothetical protein